MTSYNIWYDNSKMSSNLSNVKSKTNKLKEKNGEWDRKMRSMCMRHCLFVITKQKLFTINYIYRIII